MTNNTIFSGETNKAMIIALAVERRSQRGEDEEWLMAYE
jgi:hypothetical protein